MIAVPSRKQAMDWSLALASQGIEAVIGRDPEGSGWHLQVGEAEWDRAISTIEAYRRENVGRGWRANLPSLDLEFHPLAAGFCLFLIFWHWVVSQVAANWYAVGRMDTELVAEGAWWLLFSPIFLHADLAHLAANVTFGLIFLGLAMTRFGGGVGLLAAYLAGGGGNLLGYLVATHAYKGVGASGMMMGGLGLLTVHSIGVLRRSPRAAKHLLAGGFAGLMIFVLFGLSPDSDVVAHFGGFLCGALIGIPLSLVDPSRLGGRGLNAGCGVVFAILALVAWSCAIGFG